MSKGILKSLCAVFVLSLLIASSALAQKPQVNILTVSVDFDAQTMTITGENFNIGPNPTTASLGGFGNLNIISNDGSTIVAELPPGISAGDYTLFVSSGPGPKKNDQQSITIGAQGPEGDMGDPGTPGDPGDQGPQGPQGGQGPQGPQGPTGATGPQGPVGPAGTDGTNGADGAPGLDGLAGADGISCWDLNGNGTPESNEDINGDGFFNSADCIGPEGLQGDTGSQGPAGPQGAQGDQGIQGLTGAVGTVGPQGPQGDTGSAGSDGQDGSDGADGNDGSNGNNALVLPGGIPDLCPSLTLGESFEYGTDLNGDNMLSEVSITVTNPDGTLSVIMVDEAQGSFSVCDGADGADGSSGISNYTRSSMAIIIPGNPLNPGDTLSGSMTCASGRNVISGGCRTTVNLSLFESYPSSDTTWQCVYKNTGSSAVNPAAIVVHTICADVN